MAYDKLKATREYKAYRRTVDPSFVEKEKASRKRYAKRLSEFSKLARAFANKYPQQFEQFKQSKEKGAV
jgi:hypothetical protein